MVKWYNTAIFAVARLMAMLSGVLLVAMVGQILVEIVLRTVFSMSTNVLSEFVGYGVAAITFNTLGYALEKNALIRVTVFSGWAAKRPPLARLVEAACILFTLMITGLLVVFFWRSATGHFTRGAVSETVAEVPLWIPEAILLLGLTIFWLQLLGRGLRLAVGEPPRLGSGIEAIGER